MTYIPSSAIAFEGARAWWVTTPAIAWGQVGDDDRPCGTCDDGKLNWALVGTPFRCPDCERIGRHTFEIEVGLGYAAKAAAYIGETNYEASRTYRVSVVPGMVLPITEDDSDTRRPIISMQHGHPYLLDGKLITRIGTLPPDAKPGMFAVLVNIAPNEARS